MDMVVKVYDIDYTAILCNYLNTKLWDAEWVVFEYKNYKITMRLCTIDTQDRELILEYKILDNSRNNYYNPTTKIRINLPNLNMKVVQKQINGALFGLCEALEDTLIYRSDKYKEIDDLNDTEKDEIKTILEEYLSDNNINDKLHDQYEDYIMDEGKIQHLNSKYVDAKKYNVCTDLFEVLLDITQDETRRHYITERSTNADNLYNEIKEYSEWIEENMDEFRERVVDKLNEF